MNQSEKKCIVCELELKGRQEKYCSEECYNIMQVAKQEGYKKRITAARKKRKMIEEERLTLLEEVQLEMVRPTPKVKTELVLVDELGKPVQ